MRAGLAGSSIVLACIALAAPAAAQRTATAAAPASSPAVRVDTVPVAGAAVPAGRATADFPVPLNAVESVINDFGHYHEFLPQVRQSRIVHRRHDQVELYLQVQLLRNLGTLWALTRFRIERTADGLVANGELIDGNVQRFELRIEAHMIPRSSDTRVSLVLLGVPSFFLPHGMLAQQQPQWAERALTAMRQRAETFAHSQRARR